MEAQLEEIRDQQKATWNKFSPGWRKWDDLTMDFLRPMGDEIIRLLHPKDDELILDVAAGTGEPGLSIASRIKKGKVVITDLSDGMLEVARDNAARRGITNIETIACDVSQMPFEDNTFDAISCRFGYMFFPDMLMATKELVRVLKPGGKIAVTVWNAPDKNFWATATLSVINKNMELPKLPAGAPGLYRCAERGMIAELFYKAGLKNITESEVKGKLNAATFEVYWSFMTEVVAPVVAALSKADDEMKAKIEYEVFKSVQDNFSDGKLSFDSSALLIFGVK